MTVGDLVCLTNPRRAMHGYLGLIIEDYKNNAYLVHFGDYICTTLCDRKELKIVSSA